MNKRKKKVIGFACLLMLLVAMQTCLVSAAEVSPRYVNTTKVSVGLQISNNTANCNTSVWAENGVSKITGTIRLYNDTTRMYVATWDVNQAGSYYISSHSAAVKSGYQYTLSFIGTVYDANGVGERVGASVTKNN